MNFRNTFITLILSFCFVFISVTGAKAAVPVCPGAEQCPVAGYPDHLRNCTPPQSDNSPDEQLCNQRGRIGQCGGRNYCCPSVGGAWTLNMTACATTAPTRTPTVVPTATATAQPTITATPTPFIPNWDVNRDGSINIVDIGLIIDNYGKSPNLSPRTDVNRDGVVNIVDIGIVLDYYER